MADDQNEIRISITLDDGSVREGFARIKQGGVEAGEGLAGAFSGATKVLGELLIAYLGFEAAKKIVTESIAAAKEYETALNNVNKALFSAGSYSKDASAGFVELAEQIEATTTVSVKSALSLEALARNYTHTNEQAKALTKAAIDLAAATGKSADTALQQLGGTLDGTTGRLVKLLPQLKNLTEYQLRSGDAIALVAARFKDAASGDVNTYQGSLLKLSNAFERVYESIGSIVTQSPVIRDVIKFVADQLTQFANYVKTLSLESFFKNLIYYAAEFGRFINFAMVLPIELFYNTFELAVNAVRTLIQSVISDLAFFAAKAVNFFAPNSGIGKALQTFSDSSSDVLKDFQDKTKKSFDELGDTKFAEGIEQRFVKLQDVVSNPAPFKALAENLGTAKAKLYTLADSFEDLKNGADSSLKLLAQNSQKYFQQMGEAATKSLAGGVANAFAAMGRAAVKGQDIFKAFAGAMISALGQALIQLGAGYILIGLAETYTGNPEGPALIGVGAAMSALGGILAAVGEGVSGGGASASSSAGGGGTVSASGSPVTDNPASQVAQSKAQVQVNIHGDVFDTKETGLRIVELVNDAFTTQGAQVLVK